MHVIFVLDKGQQESGGGDREREREKRVSKLLNMMCRGGRKEK